MVIGRVFIMMRDRLLKVVIDLWDGKQGKNR